MLSETSFRISGNTRVKMSFFILNNIYKPGFGRHVKIITSMDRIRIPFSEFTFTFARSSGAGGQHINKVNSKVLLIWKIDETTACSPEVRERFKARFGQFILDNGEVHIVSQKTRSQKENIDDCIEKLHAMINEVRLPPKVRKATKPKRSAVYKRLESKKKDGEKKRLRRKDF